MTQDMRGLFFIIKGQYRHNLEPQWRNPVSENVNWCGGYDPENPNTAEWYMLLDWATLTCHRASSDLDYVLEGVVNTISKYKTKERFIETIKGLSFGSTSKTQKALDEHLGQLYSAHFAAQVKEAEDRAYAQVREQDPTVKARKRLHRKVSTPIEMVQKDQSQTPVATPRLTIKKRGLKPRNRNTTIEYEE